MTGRPFMIVNSSTKSSRLHRQELGQRRATAFRVVGEDHLAHRDDAGAFEEHVLGAAQADAPPAPKLARGAGVERGLGVGAHLEAAHAVGPDHQLGEVAGQAPAGASPPRRPAPGPRRRSTVTTSRRSGVRPATVSRLRLGVDADRARTGDAGLAHLPRATTAACEVNEPPRVVEDRLGGVHCRGCPPERSRRARGCTCARPS